jgi:hypothetical protein
MSLPMQVKLKRKAFAAKRAIHWLYGRLRAKVVPNRQKKEGS